MNRTFDARPRVSLRAARPAGFTIVELLVVVAVIAALLSLLMVAFASVRKSGAMTESMNHMRQIHVWMTQYSTDHRDTILPSQFDYSSNVNPGKVRSVPSSIGGVSRGTWADILWTRSDQLGVPTHSATGEGEIVLGNGVGMTAYRFDSPDKALYEFLENQLPNPLRSTAPNTRFSRTSTIPTPFGAGASELDMAGYFAANNFFDARPEADGGNGWFTNGQIKAPELSMYLVDSWAGETIEDEPAPFDNTIPWQDDPSSPLQVDFRYNENCLMLFLDGHLDPLQPWVDLEDLERRHKVRVHDLHVRLRGHEHDE